MTRLEALEKRLEKLEYERDVECIDHRLRSIESELGIGDYAEVESLKVDAVSTRTPGIRYRVVEPAPWEIQPHYRGEGWNPE